jgi:hypothetical protein
MKTRPGCSITFALAAALAATLGAAAAHAGYWKQQGAILFPNTTMAPHVQGAATGKDHNGTAIGQATGATTYSETRDMGKRSAWSVVVHEQTKWQASVGGIPNALVPGQVVPLSGTLMLIANTWRGTSSWVGSVSLTAYLSRHGASEYPGVGGRIVGLFGASIDFGGPEAQPKSKTVNVANTAAKAPGNDGSGRIWLVWRAAWGVAAGTKDGDLFEVRVPYVWVEGKAPANVGVVAGPGTPAPPDKRLVRPTGVDPTANLTPRQLLEQEMGTREATRKWRAFFNGNDGAVENRGKCPRVKLAGGTIVYFIMTYHYNYGEGAKNGSIWLLAEDGTLHGPWKATTVNKFYRVAVPNVRLPTGTYVVIDSDPVTWSQNAGSKGFGHVMIKARQAPGI